MQTKDGKDFYRSVSKKKLQELCRRCRLSPYMTKANLINSLYTYFKKKNLSSIDLMESLSVCSKSLIPPMECVAQSDKVVHAPKGIYRNINCPGDKNNRTIHSQFVKCSEGGDFMGAESYNKAIGSKTLQNLEYPLYNVRDNYCLTSKKRGAYCSQNELGSNENAFGYKGKYPKISLDDSSLSFAREVGVSDAPKLRSRNFDDDTCLAENASTSSIKSSKPSSSFEFYVSSEEGINLIVDMNKNPSDWPKKLESHVCSCHIESDNKYGSLLKELRLLGNSSKQIKNSFPWTTDSEHRNNNGDVQAQSSCYSIKGEGDSVVVDHPCGGDGFSQSSPTKPCNGSMEMSTLMELIEKDKEHALSPKPSSDVWNCVISGTEYGPIVGETVTLESSVIDVPQINSSSSSVVNSTPESRKSPDLLVHQNSEVGDKNCEGQTLQNTCTHVSPSLVCPEFSSTGSIEMLLSEVVSQQRDASRSSCGSDGSLEAVDAMPYVETRYDDLANPSTCQDHMSACAEERESNKLICGADTSESVQLTMEKTSEDSDADELLKIKLQYSEGEHLNGCGEQNTRGLRSSKHPCVTS